MTKLDYVYSSWLMAGVLRGVLGSAQELYPHIAGHRGSGCCRPGTQCEGSLAQGKIKVFVPSAENFSGKEISRKTRTASEPGAFSFRFGPGQTPAKVIPTLLKSLAHKTKAHAHPNRTFQAFNQGQKDSDLTESLRRRLLNPSILSQRWDICWWPRQTSVP